MRLGGGSKIYIGKMEPLEKKKTSLKIFREKYQFRFQLKHPLRIIFQIYLFLGHLALSILVAFVTSIAFEVPMMELMNILRRRKQTK